MTGRTPSIALVYPSCFHYPTWQDRVEIKTSQVLLGSYLAKFFPVRYLDFEVSIGRPNTPAQITRFRRLVRETLAATPADILAISCWTSVSLQATLCVARIWRELYPDKLIAVGGYHPSARPDDFRTPDNLIDYVVCGEGELALAEIAHGFSTAGRPAKTTVVQSASVPPDQFVSYDWSLVDDLVREHFPRGINEFCVYLSRGCPFDCSFCMESLKDRWWRAYPPEQAVAEVRNAVERFGLNGIGIADACFGMRPNWRKEFLRRFVECKPAYWVVIETRPEYLDEEDIGLLAQLKCEVQLGIESCSPRMLLLMRKTKQPEKYLARFREVSRLMSRHGVLHRANLIFNHPGETRQSLAETFAFVDEELTQRDSSLIWGPAGYMHFPGCELDRNRGYYEATFGARFERPEWWKGDEDQYAACAENVPSADLADGHVDLYKRMLAQRDGAMRSALTQVAFRWAALKYFPEWQDDPHFTKA